MNQEKERYNELISLIEQGQFNKIGQLRDYPIIKNTDLLDKLLEYYIEGDYSKDKNKLDAIEEILKKTLGESFLIQNKKFIIKFLTIQIYNGIITTIFDDDWSELLTAKEKEQLMEFLIEKIKDPDYQIKYLPIELQEDQNFINECLKNKNLSILNCIEYKEEYLQKALQLIQEGYGLTFSNSANKEYKKRLLKPLLERGYINNLHIYERLWTPETEKEDANILLIVKDQIRQGKKFSPESSRYFSRNITAQYLIGKDQELIDLLLQTNQIDFMLNAISARQLESQMDKISKKIREGYQVKKIPKVITNNNFVEALLETNQLDCMNNIRDNDWINLEQNEHFHNAFYTNIELFKTKLKEGHLFKLDLTNKSQIEQWFDIIQKDLELLKLLMENNLENLLVIMNHINHHEDLLDLYNEDFYQTTKTTLATYYQLNLEHLEQFVSKFGTKYLYYIANDNIRTAINLEEENFKKYMELFSYGKLNLTNVQNIYDSILQARFKKDHEKDINRLTRIKNSLIDPNVPFPKEDLLILANHIKSNKINDLQMLTEEELTQLNQDPLSFLITVYNKAKKQESTDRNLTIIYEINKQYLRKQRENYRNQHHYVEELKLNSYYDEKSLINALITDLTRSLIESAEILSVNELNLIIKTYDLQSIFPFLSELSIIKLLESLKQSTVEDKELIQHIKNLKKLLKYIINNEQIFSALKKKIPSSHYKIKKIYQVPNDRFQIFSILQEINPQELKDTIFNDEAIYQSLKNLLQKYKFPDWQDIFKESLSQSNLSLENYDIAAIITKFNELYKHIERKKKNKEEINLPEIINFANVLASSSSRYSMLFGEEDTKFIKLNPTPNAAPIIGNPNSRLDKATKKFFKLYQRKIITTPPIDEDIIINNKKININLGNFTNPLNLTYGERTGSCMRIMGAGETLYNFCQENENAFHIRLTDKKTGKFISRVSGFRNGNSIFLNELRYSVEQDLYSDEEVVATIKQVANMIIERTKDSSEPIKNIFITNQYAMSIDNHTQTVNIQENIKEGLPYFYFDLHDSAITLATTAKEGDYIPINTNKTNVPRYLTLRDKPKEWIEKSDILNQINKHILLKEMLTRQNPDTFFTCELWDVEKVEDILYLLNGEDWYAYLDKNQNIHTDYIPRDDNRMNYELTNAINLLEQKKEEYSYEVTNRPSHRV